MPEFENRVKVLEDLGYIDETGTVKLKGRVACEINSGDEMVATEMIFTGFLTELDPEEAVALVSAFVFQVVPLLVCDYWYSDFYADYHACR